MTEGQVTINKDWKFYLGISLFVYSFLPYVFMFAILPFLGFSAAQGISIASIFVASSELSFLGSVALLGKPFIDLIKAKMGSCFPKRPVTPSKPISRMRHAVGVTMLLVSMITPTVLMELIFLFDVIDELGHRNALYVLLAFDILFLIGMFVLGGEFWDKFKRLFEWPESIAMDDER